TDGRAHAVMVGIEDLIRSVHWRCRPRGFKARGNAVIETDIPIPPNIAAMVLKMRGEWNLHPLAGIATAPIIYEDGTIRAIQGYDPRSAMYCDVPEDLGGRIPEHPIEADARAALLLIRTHFRSFPFADASFERCADGIDRVNLDAPPGQDESSFLA